MALIYASTFMEVRDIKKTEGNVRVHGMSSLRRRGSWLINVLTAGQKRPDYISPEAQAAVTHPHADAGSKDK